MRHYRPLHGVSKQQPKSAVGDGIATDVWTDLQLSNLEKGPGLHDIM